jgi:hypothetical protein
MGQLGSHRVFQFNFFQHAFISLIRYNLRDREQKLNVTFYSIGENLVLPASRGSEIMARSAR